MHVYQIGYGDECGSEHFQLIHEKKYSEKQFNKIIEEALFHALLKFGKPKSKWITDRKPDFDRLITGTITKKNKKTKEIYLEFPFLDFLEKRGFLRLKFEQEWDVYSGDSPLNNYKRRSTDENKKVDGIARRIQRKFFKAKPSYKEDMKEGERREEEENEKLMEKYKKDEEKYKKKAKKKAKSRKKENKK